MRDGESGSLHFGMGSSIARTLMAPMLSHLLLEAPRLKLNTIVQSTDALLAALHREELDFFVGDVRSVARDNQMRAEPVYRCTFGWFARRGHPLAGRAKVTIDALKPYPLVGSGYADEALLEQMATLYGMTLPLQDHFSVNTNDAPTLLTLLNSSNAIAPATDVAVFQDLRDGTLVRLDVNPPLNLQLTLGIIERVGRTRVPAAERAFKIVRSHFASMEQAVAPRLFRARTRREVTGKGRTSKRTLR
jgi:DNA-binding transcriptional LysR family regulator